MTREEVVAAIAAIENFVANLDMWVLGFAALVAVGVVGEAILGVWHWRLDGRLRDLRHSESQFHEADIAQLGTQAELARAAIAVANARAAEAQLALERFRAPRFLTPQQEVELSSKLVSFSRMPARVWTLTGGNDISAFAEQLARILVGAKWLVSTATSLSGRTLPGVVVVARIGSNGDRAATVIVEYLKSVGISAMLGQPSDDDGGLMPAANMGTPVGFTEPSVIVAVGSKT
jgi:hypothetical protein